MQKLGNTYITNAGKELLASVDAGNDRMIYTNAVLASNDFSTMSDDAIRQITALDTLQSAPIMVASRVKTTINLAATFTNAQVKTDFDFWSIGWFAKGDATLTDEILIAISPSETQQTMPASLNGASTASITPKYAMGLSEASEVVIQPDPAGQVSKDWVVQQINALKQQGVINNAVILTKNDDCNNKTVTSIARINGDLPKNAPASVSKSGQLITYGYGSNDQTAPVVQLYYDDGNSMDYIRYYNMAKKTWSNWDSVLTQSQFANNLPDNIADDTKVVHLAGDEEVAGKKTFDTAPINKANGKPFITADDVPAVPATLADTTKLANFTAGLQKDGKDVATVDQIPNLSAGNIAWTEIDDETSADLGYNIVYGVQNNLLTLSGDISVKQKIGDDPVAFATLPDTIASRINPKMFTTSSSKDGCIFITMHNSSFGSSSLMLDAKGGLTMRGQSPVGDYDLFVTIPLDPAK